MGFLLYWQLAELGVECEVLAPTLAPIKAGVSADRSWLLGWKQDQLRARNRLSKFPLRSGRRPVFGVRAWTLHFMAWVGQIR